MNFSWERFCSVYNIDFVTSGPSTAKGNIYIQCPYCGNDDHGHHMGLALNYREPYYACWRNQGHRGKNPARLIVMLLQCSRADAEALVASSEQNLDGYEQAVARYMASLNPAAATEATKAPLEMPSEFASVDRLLQSSAGSKPFHYLEERGFDDVANFMAYYNLRYCRTGTFARRLVVPIYQGGQLMTWTARDVTGRSDLRYHTLSAEAEVAKRQGYQPALLPINDTVFNYDRAAVGGEVLVVCEGPFDALKLDWFAPDGVVAVAVFGMPKDAQHGVLLRLAKRFEKVAVALDASATSSAVRIWQRLESVLGKAVARLDLPTGVKDPGALPGAQVPAFIASTYQGARA